jgi:hypothetical protein
VLVHPKRGYWLEALSWKSAIGMLSVEAKYFHLALAAAAVALGAHRVHPAGLRPLAHVASRTIGIVDATGELLYG